MSMAQGPFTAVQPSAAIGSTALDVPPAPAPPAQDLSKLGIPPGSDQPLFVPFDLTPIAPGASQTFLCEGGVPDFWQVALRPVAGTNVRVYAGPQASGIPIARLGGGGTVKFAGRSEHLTVTNAGAGAIDGVAVATRKFDYSVSPGAL